MEGTPNSEFYSREAFDKAQTEEERQELLAKANDEAIREDRDFNYSVIQKEQHGDGLKQEEVMHMSKEEEGGAKPFSEDERKLMEGGIEGLTFIETFTLDVKPINPKEVFAPRFTPENPTNTQSGLLIHGDFSKDKLQEKIQDRVVTAEKISISFFTLNSMTGKGFITGEELKKKLGDTKPFTLDQIATIINNQSELNGGIPKDTSPLDTSGRINVFLLEDESDRFMFVEVFWGKGFGLWNVDANYLTGEWQGGARVFCRND